MPVKFGPSVKKYAKGSRTKWHWEHDYIKAKSKEFLIEYINKEGAKPKTRIKCIKELERRGIKINWAPKSDQQQENE